MGQARLGPGLDFASASWSVWLYRAQMRLPTSEKADETRSCGKCDQLLLFPQRPVVIGMERPPSTMLERPSADVRQRLRGARLES